jgi:peptidoglycan hydrolase-like protein with peptidoglycan-binding domain
VKTSNNNLMKIKVAALIFFASLAAVRADQLIESVQQALKNQGFYYGEVTGETNANLTAAIRRYQIRNGLQVTGNLNNETLQSLGIGSYASVQPTAKPAPSASAGAPDLTNRSSDQTTASTPAPVQPFANAPEDRQVYPSNPVTPGASPGGLLAGTPYEAAPAGVQRDVVISAQTALARRGLYRDEIDGIFGPAMEFSLRAYQARTRLPITGRLDLETLAALQLLPRPRAPVYDPSRRRMRPPPQSPVRGEWIPE